MIDVTKEKTRGMRDIVNIHTDEGLFSIAFEKDMNLYFNYSANKLEKRDEYNFTITKDNPFVYECFDNLYDSVMNQRPYRYSENLANTEYIYPLSKCCAELVHGDGIIDWHSDDEPYDTGSALTISKDENENYILNFKRSSEGKTSVRIKNGGSLYDPYNASFMIVYNKLREHNFELDKELSSGVGRVRKR
jgi:hypothetical protein